MCFVFFLLCILCTNVVFCYCAFNRSRTCWRTASIGVRDHFLPPPIFFYWGGGGGDTPYFARILYPCPKSRICLVNAFLSHMGGGGGLFGGGGEYLLYRRSRSGRVWGVDCFGFRGTKTRFLLWVVEFKLTSTLAPNVYNDCSIRGDLFSC